MVAIKDFEMPSCCAVCDLFRDTGDCGMYCKSAYAEIPRSLYDKERYKGCPLIEIEQSEDCVSRKRLMDNYNGVETPVGYRKVVDMEVIKNLPPVTPTHGTCEHCKHRDPEDKKCDCGHDIVWQLPRKDNWYCADFERREELMSEKNE